MSDPLKMSDQTNSRDIPSAIFLLESESGVMHSDLQDGQMTDPSGPEVVRANLSARQAKEKGLMTSGTFGPRGSGSSESQNLTQFLANKLRQRVAELGSTLFRMTWKEAVTPSGRHISMLAASVPRTSGKDCTSWATTTTTRDHKDGSSDGTVPTNALLGRQVWLSAWPTTDASMRGPAKNPLEKKRPSGAKRQVSLQDAVKLSAWPTTKEQNSRGPSPKRDGLWDIAKLTSWVSPTSQDHSRGGKPARPWDKGIPLTQQVALTDSGEKPIGFGVETKNIGQLNPAHFRWLMGLPTAWDDCAAMVTPLSRKRQKTSSKLI